MCLFHNLHENYWCIGARGADGCDAGAAERDVPRRQGPGPRGAQTGPQAGRGDCAQGMLRIVCKRKVIMLPRVNLFAIIGFRQRAVVKVALGGAILGSATVYILPALMMIFTKKCPWDWIRSRTSFRICMCYSLHKRIVVDANQDSAVSDVDISPEMS